jgi:threonyl-tRNA synthetase
LIENYAGALPLWLAPVQAVALNITDQQADYAQNVAAALNKAGFRVQTDLRNEKIGYKIREHSLQKLPYQLIVGEKERAASTVAMRNRKGEDLGSMPLAKIVEQFEAEVMARSRSA